MSLPLTSYPSLPEGRGETRVLLTADTVGGVWTYALDLIRELRDVEFALATMGRALTPDQWTEVGALPNVEVHESAYRLEWMEEPWDDVRAAGDWLLGIADEFRPDVVHLNGLVHGALPFAAPKLVVVHSCVLSWWQAVKGEPAPPSWGRYADEVRRSLRAADLVAAPTRAMRDEALRLYGPFQRSKVVPNGRSGIAPAPKDPFVFAAGRMWDEAKNLRAVEAMACDWPVRIAGEGSAMGRLSGAATLDLMARASIYALPARYEPFGLSVLEAALAGCALVLGDIPSLRENWEGRAFFVRSDDAEGLEATVARLVADPSLRARMGGTARERALELGLERFGAETRALYEGLVAGHPSSCRRGESLSKDVKLHREREEGPGVVVPGVLR